MTSQQNRAFRDYATRVSFNLTLSRNQIANLRHIVFDIENEELAYEQRRQAAEQANSESPPCFIVGNKALQSMGLIDHDPRWVAENERSDAAHKVGTRYFRKYWGPSWQVTPAGEHVVELLRMAGLIPQRAVNSNVRRLKTRTRA